MRMKKMLVLGLALLLVCANVLSVLPTQVFAHEDAEPATAEMAELVPAAEKQEDKVPAEERTADEVDAAADQNFGLKPETVKELNDNWTDVKISANEIELGEYKGQDVNVVVPGSIEGKQVYIARFPGARSAGTGALTAEQAKVQTVVFKEVAGMKVKSKFFADNSNRITFGIDTLPSGFTDELRSVDMSGFYMSDFTVVSSMFRNRRNLTEIKGLETWDVSKFTDMAYMFNGLPNMTDFSSLAGWDVSSVTRMPGMFANSGVQSLEFLKNWNISKVTDMSTMFADCTQLGSLEPLAAWGNKLNVSSSLIGGIGGGMQGMFMGANVTDVSPLKNWDMSKTKTVKNMFENTPLEYADLSGWELPADANVSGMFNVPQIKGEPEITKPLLVVSKDPKLTQYSYGGDHRVPAGPAFSVDGTTQGTTGGSFVLPEVNNTVVQDIVEKTLAEKAIPMKVGYLFVKWEPTEDVSKLSPYEALTVEYEAVFKAIDYKVTFAVEGVDAAEVPAVQTVAFDTLVQKPEGVNKPGYTLVGWYTEPEFVNAWDFDKDTVPAHDVTLYAKWEKNPDPIVPSETTAPSESTAPSETTVPSETTASSATTVPGTTAHNGNGHKTPNTGDMSSLGLLGGMFASSASVFAVLLSKKNKKK